MEAAAKNLTPVTLELGGKSPTIVLKDANINQAVNRICFGKFMNCGQTCIAPDYILVEKDVEKILIDTLIKRIEEFFGKDPQQSNDYGRVINVRHIKRLQKYLENQNPIYGGRFDEKDCYLSPTLILNPDPQSLLMQEEIFGPVLPIISVSSLDHAIEFINSRPKPLSLYLFSKSKPCQQKVITHTSSGSIVLNDCSTQYTILDAPFGGVGESGMGSYKGKYTFDTFSHFKTVLDSSTWFDPFLRYPPYTDRKLYWMKKLLNFKLGPVSKVVINGVVILPISYFIFKRFFSPRL